MKTANELAHTLDYIAREKTVSGLLPDAVSKAAQMLRDQAMEIESLTRTLASKHHTVTVTATTESEFYVKIRAEAAITDPQRYFGEIRTDLMRLQDSDFIPYLGRSLTEVLTAEWMREIEEHTMRAIAPAVAELLRSRKP